jgi:hypothetical protein
VREIRTESYAARAPADKGKMQTWLRKVAAIVAAIVAARSRRRPLERCLPGGARDSRAVSGDPPETLRSACANTADFQICASSDLCIGERVVERALRTRFGGRESPLPRRETHPSCRKRARRSRSTTLPSAIRQTGASLPRQQPTHGQSSSMCFTLCGVMGGRARCCLEKHIVSPPHEPCCRSRRFGESDAQMSGKVLQQCMLLLWR